MTRKQQIQRRRDAQLAWSRAATTDKGLRAWLIIHGKLRPGAHP